MDIFHSIVLGVVQGLTEFIPVSSSGHLVLVRDIFGIHNSNDLAFDAILQLATACAVLIYFARDIWGMVFDRSRRKELGFIVIGTIPAVLFGLLLEEYMETVFRGTGIVIVTLLIGSVLMWVAERVAKLYKVLNYRNAFIIGLFQCLALIPGMSRSGSTISGGLILGLTRESATRFSFLLSFPILFGSGLKKLGDVFNVGQSNELASLVIASFVAFLVGLAAIHFLISYLKTRTLKVFIWYRILLAVVLLLFIF